ncbi:MAG: VOC family protein [Ignavibacteriota bacterium]
MSGSPLRFAGVELYFHDLDRARNFYREVLGLEVADEEPEHYTPLR